MSLFGSILEKIGIGKPAAAAAKPVTDAAAQAKADAAVSAAMQKAAEEAKARLAASPAKPVTAASVSSSPVSSSPTIAPAPPTTMPSPPPVASTSPAPAPLAPASVSLVDVVSHLETLAKAHPGLNWKVSIVDLLKLLDLDSSFEARKALAAELGCPANLMSDSASMNIWLHKTVLQKIAENGGNIPTSMLN